MEHSLQMKAAIQTQDARMRLICRKYGVENVLDHITRPCFDTKQHYHNQLHCTVVARWCHDLLALDDSLATPYDYRILLAAALFHDFGHDGISSDDKQIEVAVTNAQAFLSSSHCDFSGLDVFRICELIEVTQYDGNMKFHREPKSLLEQIIRDADLMQVLEPNHIEMVLDGLRLELSQKIDREMSRADFCKGQVFFMQNVELFTPQAKHIYAAATPAIIASFKAATFG